MARSAQPPTGNDLFAAAAEEHLAQQAPLAARLRPQSLDDIVGQDELVGRGKPLRVLVEADRLSSVILWGPPGTGKTTLAQVIALHTSQAYEQLSAVSATVKDVREAVARAEQRLGERGQGTILFLDEVHRFNKAQQDALLPSVESGLLVLVGATTENPYFEVNAPLMSRSTLFRLQPLGPEAIAQLLRKGLEAEGARADDDAIDHLAERAGGDGRQALTSLEVAVALARAREAEAGEADPDVPPTVTAVDAEAALGTKIQRYGRDDHYDVVSAFIKSVRGSDPQAALHWLARMLEAGEDARFIARRLVILASEDVGEADPQGLVVATAAAHAVEYVGLPEAQLNLAQATVHLATAPKSNRVAMGIWNARGDVAKGVGGEVPVHLRDAHYRSAKTLGHGVGYDYPHDDPRGWVAQRYLPDDMRDATYYEPSLHGFEQEIRTRMERLAEGDDGTGGTAATGDGSRS
ncbi:MAG TPA: replication-associated recombination protein A [Acidimicrobiales bacterium]|nr:replication-associated recombination protein A [Acidimicrobiales bacterium]